jgi:hypothetical protein
VNKFYRHNDIIQYRVLVAVNEAGYGRSKKIEMTSVGSRWMKDARSRTTPASFFGSFEPSCFTTELARNARFVGVVAGNFFGGPLSSAGSTIRAYRSRSSEAVDQFENNLFDRPARCVWAQEAVNRFLAEGKRDKAAEYSANRDIVCKTR